MNDASVSADGLEAKQRLHMGLLYSKRVAAMARRSLAEQAAGLSAETKAFLQNVDFELLVLEQEHRLGDLCKVLRRSCPSFCVAVGSELMSLAAAYCDSESFWQFRGRTLEENFCIWSYQALKARDLLAAEAARLDGTIHGLESHPAAPSPWNDNDKQPGQEAYVARRTLVDDNGQLLCSENLNALRGAAAYPTRVALSIDADGIRVDLTPLSHKE